MQGSEEELWNQYQYKAAEGKPTEDQLWGQYQDTTQRQSTAVAAGIPYSNTSGPLADAAYTVGKVGKVLTAAGQGAADEWGVMKGVTGQSLYESMDPEDAKNDKAIVKSGNEGWLRPLAAKIAAQELANVSHIAAPVMAAGAGVMAGVQELGEQLPRPLGETLELGLGAAPMLHIPEGGIAEGAKGEPPTVDLRPWMNTIQRLQEARAKGVIGPEGERGFFGLTEITPAERQARMEAAQESGSTAILENGKPPTLDDLAQRINPEAFQQRADLQDQLDLIRRSKTTIQESKEEQSDIQFLRMKEDEILSSVNYNEEELPEPAEEDAELRKKFVELGKLQRDIPEHAMLDVQRTTGGGVLNPVVEHVGDITHRMTEMLKYLSSGDVSSTGYEFVKPKVERAIAALSHGYGFDREFKENLGENARYRNQSIFELSNNVDKALERYSSAHSDLPTYNAAQTLARNAAVKLGKKDWNGALSDLRELKSHLGSQKEWHDFASEGLQVKPNKTNELSSIRSELQVRLNQTTPEEDELNQAHFQTLQRLNEIQPYINEAYTHAQSLFPKEAPGSGKVQAEGATEAPETRTAEGVVPSTEDTGTGPGSSPKGFKSLSGAATPEDLKAQIAHELANSEELEGVPALDRKSQIAKATDLVLNNKQVALDVINGRAEVPGVHPQMVLRALSIQSMIDQDLDLARDLLKSKANRDASAAGQTLSMRAGIRGDIDPIGLIEDTEKERLDKRGGGKLKAEAAVNRSATNIEDTVKQYVNRVNTDWTDFVTQLACDY